MEFAGQHSDSAEVLKLFFVPEQARLIAICADGTAHLWEMNFDQSGHGQLEEVRVVSLFDTDRRIVVSAQCFSKDNRTVFLGSESGAVYALRVPELTVEETLRPDMLLAG